MKNLAARAVLGDNNISTKEDKKATICKCKSCRLESSALTVDTACGISGLTGFVVFLERKSLFLEFCYIYKGPVLAIMLRAPLLSFWFSRERGVHCTCY